MDFIVYLLFSELKNKYYVGFTSDIEGRIKRHNQKSNGFNGAVNDWQFIYTENYSSKEKALEREKKIKSWKSKIKIEELIKNKD